MKNILIMAWKEMIQLKRDKKVFPILFIAPVVQIILLGLAATLEVKNTSFVSIEGRGNIPLSLIEKSLYATDYFDFKGRISSLEEGVDLMKNGKVDVIIENSEPLRVVIDGTNSNSARIITSYIKTALRNVLTGEKGREAKISPSLFVLYNEKLESKNFMVPGVFVTILLVMTMVLTALSVVREKEQGTIEQIVTTPIGKTAFIVGKMTPYVFIGLIEACILLIVGVFVLNVPFRGSVFTLLLFSLLFIINTLGAGMFFSVISRTQQQAMLSIFMATLPLIILSGFIFPIENMPYVLQVIAKFDPLTYFVKSVRYIFLRGSCLRELKYEAFMLFLIGSIIFSLSVIFFRKRVQ